MTAMMITTMKVSNEKLVLTRPSDRPSATMAKTRLKPPSTSFAALKGLLGVKGSTLGSPSGWKCCWPGCWCVSWAIVLKRAATGFSGRFCSWTAGAGGLLDCWLRSMMRGGGFQYKRERLRRK